MAYVSRLRNGTEILGAIDWEKELRAPGMSDPKPYYSNSAIHGARELAREYARLNGTSPPDPGRYQRLYTNLKVLFVIELIKLDATQESIARVDSDQVISTAEHNPEILFYWTILNIPKRRLDPVWGCIEEIVSSYGRNKYLYPIYRALIAADLDRARQLFQKHYWRYTRNVVEDIRGFFGKE